MTTRIYKYIIRVKKSSEDVHNAYIFFPPRQTLVFRKNGSSIVME